MDDHVTAFNTTDEDRRDDRTLLAAVRSGDASAFGEIYRRYEDLVQRAAVRLVPSREVDDLVAETFSKVLGALQSGKGPADEPAAYLRVAVRTTAYTFHHRRARDLARIQEVRDQTITTWEGPAVRDDCLAEAMRSLPSRWRQVLWWTVVEGRSPREVGERLEIGTAAATSLSYRARRALRSAYAEAVANLAPDEGEPTTGPCGAPVSER